jgi:tetratricopeptide (TPR) repeat protein
MPLGAARYELVRQEKTSTATQIRRDLDVLAINYVNIDVSEASVFENYVEWYTTFINRWGMTDFLQKSMDTALYNLLALCYHQKDYQQAIAAYEKYKGYVTQKQITTCQEVLADTFFGSSIEDLDAQEQITLINQTLARSENMHEAFLKRGELYLENAWLAYLNYYMDQQDYKSGYDKSEEALAQLPKSSKIKKMRQVFYSNTIAIIHNNFADEANSGNLTRAREILEEGLLHFPDDKTLKSDLQLLNKRTSN